MSLGRVDMARVFWQHESRDSDPIRLALIASQVSKRAAIARPSEAQMYESNADTFEKWACSVLDKCPTQSHATIVLMRPSRTWPGTILQTAMEGESKTFVAHKYVQTLIDEYWRGNLYGSDGALSSSVSSLRVLAHLFVPTIDKQEVELDASVWDNLERKRKAIQLSEEMQELSPSRRDSGAGGSRWGGAGGMATTALDTLDEVPPCCCYPSPFAPGVGLCTRAYNLLACCFNCCGQCCTCLCCLHCFKCLRGLFHIRWLNMRWFFAVPRVKYLLRIVSYIAFLGIYTKVLMSNASAPVSIRVELLFAFFCYGFWVDELFQWRTNAASGIAHFASTANLFAVPTLTLQTLASTTRILFSAFEPNVWHRQLHGGYIDDANEVAACSFPCRAIWYSQVMLAICGLHAFGPGLWCLLRMNQKYGVLVMVLARLGEDVIVFSGILLALMAYFTASFVAMMPSLGADDYSTDSAFALPWWALFGEFNELERIGDAGGWTGPALLWTFSFLTQVVLVNLLIAMMSETYTKVQEVGEVEWRYSRFYIVEEFVRSHWIPPPFSLPVLVYELSNDMYRLFCSKLASGCGCCIELISSCCRSTPRNRHARLRSSTLKLHRIPSLSLSLGYQRGVKVVTLLDTLPEAVLDVMARQDLTWLTDLLDDEEGESEGMTDTKISALQLDVTRLTDKCLEIQESLINLHAHLREGTHGGGMRPFGGSLRAGAAAESNVKNLEERTQTLEERAVASPIADAALVESLRKQLNDTQRALAAHSTAHVHARSQQNPRYPPRFPVEDAKVSWKVPWPEYSPVPFVAPSVLAAERSDTNPNGWADNPRPNLAELKHRLSCEGPLVFDADQRPINPRGRTGVCGRGMLGKWGPNRAADPIVTRWKPGDKQKLQVVAIQRGDTGVWALPGGMVDDAGEVVSVTVQREFAEEAGNMASDAERAAFNAAVDELFAHGEVVYRGYVDDPRNTDNAWMETTAFHFHCSPDLAVQLPLRAGDDAHNVTWLDVDDAEPRYAALYASHKDWVDRVAYELRLRKDYAPRAVDAPAEATRTAQQAPRKPQRGMLGRFGARLGSPSPRATSTSLPP